MTEREIPAPSGDAERPVTGSGSRHGSRQPRRSGIDDARAAADLGQAGESARGLVSQGLERSAEALANVAKLVGDTAPGSRSALGPNMATMPAAPRRRSRMSPTPIADEGPRRADRGHAQFRSQQPGHRARRRGRCRLRRRAAAEDRPRRARTRTTKTDAQAGRPGDQPAERPVGELVHELIEDGKAYARAELGLGQGDRSSQGQGTVTCRRSCSARRSSSRLAAITRWRSASCIALATLHRSARGGFVGLPDLRRRSPAVLGWYGYERLRREL